MSGCLGLIGQRYDWGSTTSDLPALWRKGPGTDGGDSKNAEGDWSRNNCAFFAAVFTVAVCSGQNYIGAFFESEIKQRQWFFYIVKGGEIISFPFSESPGILTKAFPTVIIITL